MSALIRYALSSFVGVALTACASAGGRPPIGAPAVVVTPAPVVADEGSLSALQRALRSGDRGALEGAGVTLASGAGRRELTGEAADDERVLSVSLIARAGERREAVAFLLQTSCGNAVVLGYAARPNAWEPRARSELVRGELPGSCARTIARGDALALSSDERRELAITWATQDEVGDRAIGPVLRVLRLEHDGSLRELLHDAPFGGTDESTGIVTDGRFSVLDDTPPPRGLFITVRRHDESRSGRPPAGQRREYELRGDALELRRTVEERAE